MASKKTDIMLHSLCVHELPAHLQMLTFGDSQKKTPIKKVTTANQVAALKRAKICHRSRTKRRTQIQRKEVGDFEFKISWRAAQDEKTVKKLKKEGYRKKMLTEALKRKKKKAALINKLIKPTATKTKTTYLYKDCN